MESVNSKPGEGRTHRDMVAAHVSDSHVRPAGALLRGSAALGTSASALRPWGSSSHSHRQPLPAACVQGSAGVELGGLMSVMDFGHSYMLLLYFLTLFLLSTCFPSSATERGSLLVVGMEKGVQCLDSASTQIPMGSQTHLQDLCTPVFVSSVHPENAEGTVCKDELKRITLQFFHQYFLFNLAALVSNWEAPACSASARSSNSESF